MIDVPYILLHILLHIVRLLHMATPHHFWLLHILPHPYSTDTPSIGRDPPEPAQGSRGAYRPPPSVRSGISYRRMGNTQP